MRIEEECYNKKVSKIKIRGKLNMTKLSKKNKLKYFDENNGNELSVLETQNNSIGYEATVSDGVNKKEKKNKKLKETSEVADHATFIKSFEVGDSVSHETSTNNKSKKKKHKSADSQCEHYVLIEKESEKLSGHLPDEDYHQEPLFDDASMKKKGERKRTKSEDILLLEDATFKQEDLTYGGLTFEDHHQRSSASSTSKKKKHKKREEDLGDFSGMEGVKIKQNYKTSSDPLCEDHPNTNFDAASTTQKIEKRKKKSEDVSLIKEVFVRQEEGTSCSHAFKGEDHGGNAVHDISVNKEKKKRKIKSVYSHFDEENLVECEGSKQIQIEKSKVEKGTSERTPDEASASQEALFVDSLRQKKKKKGKRSKDDSSIKTESNNFSEVAFDEIPCQKNRKIQSEIYQHEANIKNADMATSTDTPQKKVKKKKKVKADTPQHPDEAANPGEKTIKDQLKNDLDQSKNELKQNIKSCKRDKRHKKSEGADELNNNDISVNSTTVNTTVAKLIQYHKGKSQPSHGEETLSKKASQGKCESRKRRKDKGKLAGTLSNTAYDENILSGDTRKIAFTFKTHPVVKDYVPRRLLKINGISPYLIVDEVNLKIPEIMFNGSSLNEIEGYGAG